MGSQGDGSCYKLVLLWMGREGFGERPRFVGDGLFGSVRHEGLSWGLGLSRAPLALCRSGRGLGEARR